MAEDHLESLERRSFLSRIGIGVAALGAGAAASLPSGAQAAAAARWQPALHPVDDWLERPKAKHRFVFDSTTPGAAGSALLYAGNYFTANKSGYNVEPTDLAIVIVFRHFSTPFAYTDAVWAKYGAQFSEALEFTDPKTKQAPGTNLYDSADYGPALPNFGTTISTLVQQGAHFAVCDMATHFLASLLADKTKGDADSIYRELISSFYPNSHLVPAGIVAVNRAQERGYSFAYAG
jgi:hypothetical protein